MTEAAWRNLDLTHNVMVWGSTICHLQQEQIWSRFRIMFLPVNCTDQEKRFQRALTEMLFSIFPFARKPGIIKLVSHYWVTRDAHKHVRTCTCPAVWLALFSEHLVSSNPLVQPLQTNAYTPRPCATCSHLSSLPLVSAWKAAVHIEKRYHINNPKVNWNSFRQSAHIYWVWS